MANSRMNRELRQTSKIIMNVANYFCDPNIFVSLGDLNMIVASTRGSFLPRV